jgi:hypothetical protein
MKRLLLIGLGCGLFGPLAPAQTLVNHRLNFVCAASSCSCATNIVVPTNTTARIVNYHSSNIDTFLLAIAYPGSPDLGDNLATALAKPVLGPATLKFTATGFPGCAAYVLVQFDPVNAATSDQAVTVQPGGTKAVVALQVSTNLNTWLTTSNATTTAQGNQFYRVSLTLTN